MVETKQDPSLITWEPLSDHFAYIAIIDVKVRMWCTSFHFILLLTSAVKVNFGQNPFNNYLERNS